MPLSVVIITRNEAHIIGNTLQSLQGLTDDIVIVDSGSTDDTIAICKKFSALVIETSWDGYGPNKNKGIDAAKYDWILNIDADEAIDEILKGHLLQLNEKDDGIVFEATFRNFFCGKHIRFGEWSGDKHIRFFNRKKVRWNDAAVHEELLLPENVEIKKLNGNILHYTSNNIDDHILKTIAYAKLNAEKYFRQNKKAGFFNLRIAPRLNFIQHYVLRLGFLDGWEGYFIARTTAWYTFLKYSYLKEMNNRSQKF